MLPIAQLEQIRLLTKTRKALHDRGFPTYNRSDLPYGQWSIVVEKDFRNMNKVQVKVLGSGYVSECEYLIQQTCYALSKNKITPHLSLRYCNLITVKT